LHPSSKQVHDAAIEHLNSRGFIQFHTVLAQKLDNFKAAIFLGHALYWTRYQSINHPYRDGWFFMTAREWEKATGLTPREQTAVRALLVEARLVMEALADHPAKLHFKVDLSVLTQWMGVGKIHRVTWETIGQFASPSVSYFKPLADISGGVATGLYLSYLLNCQRRLYSSPQPNDSLQAGFFSVKLEDVRVALSLGPKTQRTARDKLKLGGLMTEGRSNATSSQLLVRLNMQAIHSCLLGRESAPLPQRRGSVPRSVSAPVEAPQGRATTAPSAEVASTSLLMSSPASTGNRPELRRRERRRLQLPLFGPLQVRAGQPHQESPAGDAPSVQADAVQLLIGRSDRQPFQLADFAQPTPMRSQALRKRAPALLSKLGCPFVEPALPFCPNIQGGPAIKPTTTTPATDGYVELAESVTGSGSGFDSKLPPKPIPSAVEAGAKSERSQAMPAIEQSTTGVVLKVPPIDAGPVGNAEADTLIFPKALDEGWHSAVRTALKAAPIVIRQPLLDELEGQLTLKQIHNPPGWLHTLIGKHRQGALVLSMAGKVAADREQRAHVLAQLARVANAAPRELPKPVSACAPDPVPKSAVRDEHLQLLRTKLAIIRRGKA
jgi:hypothetical protein